jgi:hypothetical protein
MPNAVRKDQLARACSANDAESERGVPIIETLPNLGFNARDAEYTAVQRAMRCFAVLKGKDPLGLTMLDLRHLSNADRMVFSALAASFLDGLAVAARVMREPNG